ncbi:MAG: DUF364 domain-containing protein [Anaerolineae bacterium]
MSVLLEALLNTLPSGWRPTRLYVGHNWTLSIAQNRAGQLQAGLAATPAPEIVAAQTRFVAGASQPAGVDALTLAQGVLSGNPVEAAVGLATINALLSPPPALLTNLDAAEWLMTHGQGRRVALVGHFPFIEELKPALAHLWVLELSPCPGEYPAEQAPEIIPQAEVVAITSSSLINHTLAGLLTLVSPQAKVMLLGPSTPLTPVLFQFGIDLLSGVQVVDIEAVLASVASPANFQKMKGVRRVTMTKTE